MNAERTDASGLMKFLRGEGCTVNADCGEGISCVQADAPMAEGHARLRVRLTDSRETPTNARQICRSTPSSLLSLTPPTQGTAVRASAHPFPRPTSAAHA